MSVLLRALEILEWEAGDDEGLRAAYTTATGNPFPESFDEDSQVGENFRAWHNAQIRAAIVGLRRETSGVPAALPNTIIPKHDMTETNNRVRATRMAEFFDGIHAAAMSKGWWEKPRDFAHASMLCVGEITEATEEWRSHLLDSKYFLYGNGAEGTLVAWNAETGGFDLLRSAGKGQFDVLQEGVEFPANVKPEGIASELADCIVRIADLCGFWKIPLALALVMKVDFNSTRGHRHGRQA